MRHIFQKLPHYSDSLLPGLLWVKCPGWHGHACGRPSQQYFGPKNRDERAALLRFTRSALAGAFLAMKKSEIR